MVYESIPKSLYKIVPSTPPNPVPQQYPLSELDKNDGFVHLSTAEQVCHGFNEESIQHVCNSSADATKVPKTADLFFKDIATLWVVKLRFADFEPSTKWEDGFPHLYGNFGKDNVSSIERFDRAENQVWSEAMKNSRWLE